MSRLFSRCTLSLAALSAIPLTILTGCGAATSFSGPSVAASIHGKAFGGQQPVANATVSVWQVGTTGYGSSASSTPLATTTTATDGSFAFPANSYACTPGEQVYITAAGGQAVTGIDNPNLMLATGLGYCADAQNATVEINEVTTAVTAFALAQFFTPTLGASSTDSFGTDPADITSFTLSNANTIPTLIDVPSGTVNPNTSLITIEAAKIYSLANTLAACVNDSTTGFTLCQQLYTDTTSTAVGSTAPTDTLQAAVQIARYPYQNVTDLFKLATKTPPFTGLATAPNDWTIGVSYTSSAYALAIAGTATSSTSATIDIDAAGNIWFPTNLAGSTGLGYFSPSTAAFAGPYVNDGTLAQPQYVAIDNAGYVWVTDPSSPHFAYASSTNPTVTYNYGTVVNGALSTGPAAGDGNGNMYFSFIDSTNAAQLEEATPGVYSVVGPSFTYDPTGLTVGPDIYASTSGSGTPCAGEGIADLGEGYTDYVQVKTTSTCTSGGVAFATQAQDALTASSSLNGYCEALAATCLTNPNLSLPEGIATDGNGNEWFANSGSASVFTLGSYADSYGQTSPVPYLHDASNGNTMTTPYAIAIDGSGNVWIANAGCVTTSATPCTPGAFVLSELIGVAGPTITPLSDQMVNGGFLVGLPPGTPVPIPAASTHPHSFFPASTGKSSSTLNPSGKPSNVVLHR
jgi:hypothetical protein